MVQSGMYDKACQYCHLQHMSRYKLAHAPCRTLDQSHHSRPPVRRSVSSNMMPLRRQLREPTPSRLSPHAQHSQAARQDRLSWEKELLQMQIASSALIKAPDDPLAAGIADPQVIAEVTEATSSSQTVSAGGQAQPTSQAAQDQETPNSAETEQSADRCQQQVIIAEKLPSLTRSSPEAIILVEAQNARSIASPFFAAAQQFTLQNEQGLSRPPPPLCIPEGVDADEVYAGLALQRQTETAEIVIPSASFTSLASSPTLPEHALAVLPLSPQNTAKGFLTADSFKHEPGTTLLDCTEPTPNQSVDLDNGNLARLAQLLPDLPFPPNKRVKRNISWQLDSLAERTSVEEEKADSQQSGPRSGTAHHSPVLGPVSEPSATDQKPPVMINRGLRPSDYSKGLRLSETGIVLEGEGSQAGQPNQIAAAICAV